MYEVKKIKDKLAGEIRMRRAYHKLTQADLSQMVGCSLPSIISAEKGDVSLDLLCKIANAINDHEEGGKSGKKATLI